MVLSMAWFKSIQDIHNRLLQKDGALSLQVDVTATPKHNNGAIFVQTVADYPLVEAIKPFTLAPAWDEWLLIMNRGTGIVAARSRCCSSPGFMASRTRCGRCYRQTRRRRI